MKRRLLRIQLNVGLLCTFMCALVIAKTQLSEWCEWFKHYRGSSPMVGRISTVIYQNHNILQMAATNTSHFQTPWYSWKAMGQDGPKGPWKQFSSCQPIVGTDQCSPQVRYSWNRVCCPLEYYTRRKGFLFARSECDPSVLCYLLNSR